MDKQSDEQKSDPKTHAGAAQGEHDPEEPKSKPSADEPVTHEEHDPEALEEAEEKMLLREPGQR